MTASAKTLRRPRAGNGAKNRSLPSTAAVTQIGGQSLLIVPVADFESWMEDQIDAALARQALAEDKPRIPMAEAHRRLGIK